MRRSDAGGFIRTGGFAKRVELGQEPPPLHLHRTSRARWGVRDLAVDESEAERAQVRERGLGSIGDAAEHGLAEEHAADGDAVQPAGEVRAAPALDGVGVPGAVQPAVGRRHPRGDPGAVLPRAGRGAFMHHAVEGGVSGDRERPAPQRAAEAPAQPEGVRPQDGAGVGRPPQDRLPFAEPGEDAAAVGAQQAAGIEVAAGREQSVRFVEREIRIGKCVRGPVLHDRKGRRVFNSLTCLWSRRVPPVLVQPPPPAQGIGSELSAGSWRGIRRSAAKRTPLQRAGSDEAAVPFLFQRNRRCPRKASDRSRHRFVAGGPQWPGRRLRIYGSPARRAIG